MAGGCRRQPRGRDGRRGRRRELRRARARGASTLPRSELAKGAAAASKEVAERIARVGVRAHAEHRAGPVVRGVLVFAEEQEADVIVVGATIRGAVARRMLGTVTTRLIERSRRPVLVITPPPTP